MADFFVSYSHIDAQFVLSLEDRLASENMTVWIDTHLQSGDEWKKQIDLQIRQSKGLIVIITPVSLASPYVTYEWSFAKGLDKPVVPILLETVKEEYLHVVTKQPEKLVLERKLEIHPRLDDHQRIDFTSPNEAIWQKLIDDLKKIAQGGVPSELAKYWEELHSSNVQERDHAIDYLERYQDDKASDVLAMATEQHKVADVRRKCTNALSRKTKGKDVRILKGFREMTHDASHNGNAINLLNTVIDIDDSDADELIMLVLTENEDHRMRTLAAQGLGKRKAIIAADALLGTFVNDKNFGVKVASANALVDLKDNRITAKILEVFQAWSAGHDQIHDDTFKGLIAALGRYGADGIDVLLSLLSPMAPSPQFWNGQILEVLKTVDGNDKEIVVNFVNDKIKQFPNIYDANRDFWQLTIKRALKLP